MKKKLSGLTTLPILPYFQICLSDFWQTHHPFSLKKEKKLEKIFSILFWEKFLLKVFSHRTLFMHSLPERFLYKIISLFVSHSSIFSVCNPTHFDLINCLHKVSSVMIFERIPDKVWERLWSPAHHKKTRWGSLQYWFFTSFLSDAIVRRNKINRICVMVQILNLVR